MTEDFDSPGGLEPTTDPKLRAIRVDMGTRIEGTEAMLLRRLKLVASVLGVGTAIIGLGAGGLAFLVRQARAEDAGTQVHELRDQVQRNEADHAQVHLQMKQDTHEVQADIRSLYKAVMTGRPQPRLERPVDGGVP